MRRYLVFIAAATMLLGLIGCSHFSKTKPQHEPPPYPMMPPPAPPPNAFTPPPG